jgi:hypothetical protein
LTRAVRLAGWVLLIAAASMPTIAAAASQDPAALAQAIAAAQDPRVSQTVVRIEGVDRRLLALRAYLRAGSGLAQRWSWTADEIAAFGQSAESRAIQAQIEQVRQAFTAANPGFELWVNPQVRSLDTQLMNWNSNTSVGRAAARLLVDFREWLSSAEVMAKTPVDVQKAAEKFLTAYVPEPIPTLAAPGLSPHGQMRAIDFQIRKDGKTVAGPVSATIKTVWDASGWTEKLKAAVRAGSTHFTGPLESPREPWHYTYSPAL